MSPWVFAVKKKPTKETNIVYKAPLANIFHTGRACPGSHRFPTRVNEIVQSFFISFFSATADLSHRSVKFPRNVIDLWVYLDKKKRFQKADLVEQSTVRHLMEMEV